MPASGVLALVIWALGRCAALPLPAPAARTCAGTFLAEVLSSAHVRALNIVAMRPGELVETWLPCVPVPATVSFLGVSRNKPHLLLSGDLFDDLEAAYFIFVRDEASLVEDLEVLRQRQRFLTKRKTFVIFSGENVTQQFNIFHILWNNLRISDLIMLHASQRRGGYVLEPKFTIFNPFEDEDKSVSSYSFDNVKHLERNIIKKFHDMKGFPLRVSMFPRKYSAILSSSEANLYTGSDGEILSGLSRYMNFTPVVRLPSYGKEYHQKLENDEYTRGIEDLISDRADLVFNSYFVKDYGTRDVEYTMPIGFDKLCVVVPKSLKVPRWLSIVVGFSPQICLMNAMAYCACVLLLRGVKRVCEWKRPMGSPRILANIMFIDIALPLHCIPRTISVRILLFACLCHSLLMSNFFQSQLVTLMTTPLHFENINTIKALEDSGIKIANEAANLDNTFGSESPLSTRIVHVSWRVGAMRYASDHPGLGGIVRWSDWNSEKALYKNLHLAEECPRNFFLAYVLPKNSPFLQTVDRYLALISQSGIAKKLWCDFQACSDTSEIAGVQTYKQLSLKDLKVAFFILAVGHFLSSMAFGFAVKDFVFLKIKKIIAKFKKVIRLM